MKATLLMMLVGADERFGNELDNGCYRGVQKG